MAQNNAETLTQDTIDWFFNKNKFHYFKDPNRAKKMCEMRLQGATYKKIAEAVHTDSSYARETVLKVIRLYNRYNRKKSTNFDRIRNLTLDEMAEFICRLDNSYDFDRIKRWLEREVTDRVFKRCLVQYLAWEVTGKMLKCGECPLHCENKILTEGL